MCESFSEFSFKKVLPSAEATGMIFRWYRFRSDKYGLCEAAEETKSSIFYHYIY